MKANRLLRVREGERGFSLIELMLVIGIILAITVAATPFMVNVVSSARMRGSMMSMATLAQKVRGDSVRMNVTKSIWNTQINSEYYLYSADSQDTPPGISAAENQMPAGKQVVYVGSPTGAGVPTTLDPATAFGSSTITVETNTAISFNSRGMPCLWSSGSCSTTGVAFVWYYIFQPPLGSNRWACLSISPAGRIKTWYWDGAAWKN